MRLLLAVLTLLVAACGGGAPDAGAPEIGGGAGDELVVSLTYEGGFVPVEAALVTLPQVAVYADGTALAQGGDAGELVALELPAAARGELRDALAAVDLAALPDELEPGGEVMVADAHTATIRVAADGGTQTVSAYALGFPELQYPDEVVALHDTLTRVADTVRAEGRPWSPDAAQLIAVDAAAVGAQAGVPATWPEGVPVPDDLAGATYEDRATTVITAEQLESLRHASATPGLSTYRAPDGTTALVTWRPLLPHETA